jgi:hypothetical protein
VDHASRAWGFAIRLQLLAIADASSDSHALVLHESPPAICAPIPRESVQEMPAAIFALIRRQSVHESPAAILAPIPGLPMAIPIPRSRQMSLVNTNASCATSSAID